MILCNLLLGGLGWITFPPSSSPSSEVKSTERVRIEDFDHDLAVAVGSFSKPFEPVLRIFPQMIPSFWVHFGNAQRRPVGNVTASPHECASRALPLVLRDRRGVATSDGTLDETG